MSATPTSSHAYGVGAIALIVALSATTIFYTSFYLPESLAKPSVSDHILHPDETYVIDIVPGALLEGNDNYVPNNPTVLLTINNLVTWTNSDDTGHTVTADHRHEDSYSGSFGTREVILPGDSYTFLFTEPQVVTYHCVPHPWMTGIITVEKSKF